jgi:hypothetical protein
MYPQTPIEPLTENMEVPRFVKIMPELAFLEKGLHAKMKVALCYD